MGLLEEFPGLKHRISVEAYHRMGDAEVFSPGAADVLHIIEVADSTQRLDRRFKVPLYARHCVPEVWVIDLENALVHFHRRPDNGSYADISATGHPAVTPIAALPGISIDLSGIL